jgi:poly-beta-1,6-N-acetyl-D-glucosamine synthase
MMQPSLGYVVVTPARNEAKFIELTLRSMVAQTARPLRWVIVSDGSTDGTDDIVRRYLADHKWIELVRMPERKERNFAGKVHAFNAGCARVADLEYEVIANLDADVSFEEDHFRNLVSKFAEHPELGVVGAPFREGTFQYNYKFTNIENVWGGCQLFRRKCFEDIDGYRPVRGGCIDHVAVVSARMKGWKTRTFTETVSIHHRVMGTAQGGGLAAKFKYGAKDYSVGNHPVWELFRAVYQMKQRPYGIGGLALASGYCWSMIRCMKRPVSNDLIAFTRREQMRRLSGFFDGKSLVRLAWPFKNKTTVGEGIR